jgi:hypothetical protein
VLQVLGHDEREILAGLGECFLEGWGVQKLEDVN